MATWRAALSLLSICAFVGWSTVAAVFGDGKDWAFTVFPHVVFVAVPIGLIWVNRCRDCKRRVIWAHPESEKVCRNCNIVRELTGHNPGDWNST